MIFGKIALSEFMNQYNELETVILTFHMTDVVRQMDRNFKDILCSTKNRIFIIKKYFYLINRYLSKIYKNKNDVFDKATHCITK